MLTSCSVLSTLISKRWSLIRVGRKERTREAKAAGRCGGVGAHAAAPRIIIGERNPAPDMVVRHCKQSDMLNSYGHISIQCVADINNERVPQYTRANLFMGSLWHVNSLTVLLTNKWYNLRETLLAYNTFLSYHTSFICPLRAFNWKLDPLLSRF